MKVKNQILFQIIFIFSISCTGFAQPSEEQIKEHFMQYLNTNDMLDYVIESLPSKKECKLVFKKEYAKEYHKWIHKQVKEKPPEKSPQPKIKVDVQVKSFITEQIPTKAAGAVKHIQDQLRPGITFYKISMLKEKGADYGIAYKYWVYINGKWLFFPLVKYGVYVNDNS